MDRLPLDPDLTPPILRQSLFCDAHRAGHDFQPADNGGLQTLRRRLHFLQHAVDAKTDTEFLVERLEMNVTRAYAMRFGQQHRYHADNGRIRFIAFRRGRAVADFQIEIDIFADFLLKDVGGFVGGAVVLDERLADFFRACANELDLALQKKTQAVNRVDVERITHGHDQPGLAKRHRNDFEPARVSGADL